MASVGKALAKEKKIRLTVDVPPSFYRRLTELEELVEVGTKANLIREALKLYESVTRMALEGHEFYAEKDGEQKKIIFMGSIPPADDR